MQCESADYGKAVMGCYFARLKHASDARLSHYTLGKGHPTKEMTVEIGALELDAGTNQSIHFFGTLRACKGTAHEHLHQFLGLYESSSPDLPAMLAGAFHYDQCVDRLGYGHTFPLAESSTLRTSGYAAAIVLDSGMYTPFAEMDATLDGVPTTFYSVIPIKSDEWSLKRQHGLSALMKSWDQHSRDILRVDIAPVS